MRLRTTSASLGLASPTAAAASTRRCECASPTSLKFCNCVQPIVVPVKCQQYDFCPPFSNVCTRSACAMFAVQLSHCQVPGQKSLMQQVGWQCRVCSRPTLCTTKRRSSSAQRGRPSARLSQQQADRKTRGIDQASQESGHGACRGFQQGE